jgi:hypothetical protein
MADVRHRVLGIIWLLALALLVGANAWLIRGCLVPFAQPDRFEYLVLLHPIRALFVSAYGALLVLLTAHLVCARYARAVIAKPQRPGPVWLQALDWNSLKYLSPTLLLLLPLASVALLATPLSRYAPPWLYVSIDLQWWLFFAIVTLIAANADGAMRTFDKRWIDRMEAFARSTSGGIALAAVLLGASLLSSPPLRFQSVLVGDEPKYLRYLENWYRGRGMDVGDLPPIAELPADFKPRPLSNVAHIATAITGIARDIARPARTDASVTADQNRAKSLGGWFVAGRRGGVYQVHNPGMSFLLFPGYLIDRALVSHTHAWHPLFPTDLYATNLTLLLMYVLWGLAIFQLMLACTGRAIVSWMITSIVFLSLPTTPFAYQYYPEAPAGLAAAWLARYALLTRDTRVRSAIGHGLLAGFLPWLHLRFALLAIAAVAAVAISRRRDRSTLIAFGVAFVLPVFALGLYYFHISGSMMPWALYRLAGEEPLFSAARVWHDLPAMWLDRTWGLLANAPIFLLALPGMWITWRRHKTIAVAIGAAILILAIPAAGHGYTGAFTTPLRLVAAVLPLLALPLADAAIEFRRSRWFVVSFVLLAAISIQNGLSYNVHLMKNESQLQAATTSGWLSPLLLPDFEAGHRLAQPLTWIWILVTIAVALLPVWSARHALREPRAGAAAGGETGHTGSWTAVTALIIILFAAAGSIAGAVSGVRHADRFALRPGDARDRLIHFELTEHPGVRWSSNTGRVAIPAYFPNPDGTATNVTAAPEQLPVRGEVHVDIDVRRPGNRAGWGTASITFGDGSQTNVPVEGWAQARHAYLQPGNYRLRVELSLWGLGDRTFEWSIDVGN